MEKHEWNKLKCFHVFSAFNYGTGAMRRRIIKDETFSFHCFSHIFSCFSFDVNLFHYGFGGFAFTAGVFSFSFHFFFMISAVDILWFFTLGGLTFSLIICGCEWTLDCVRDKQNDRGNVKSERSRGARCERDEWILWMVKHHSGEPWKKVEEGRTSGNEWDETSIDRQLWGQ